ncbi:MAG: hypothetical protein AAGJ32_11470 [Pseudomonadota bacterium]
MLTTLIQSTPSRRQTRLLAWAFRVGCVAVIALGGILSAYGAGRPTLPGWATLALFTGLLLLGLLGGQWFHDAARKTEQHRRDLRARDVFDAVRTGTQTEPFILYLRPFVSTDALAGRRLTAVRVGRGMVVNEDRLEIESEIEAALRPIAPLVALGQPLEHEGAGRIAVPETQWQDAIAALMQQAALIILLPSPRNGTLWEIDQLIDGGYLAKTLILDPPNYGSSRPDYDPETEWQAVQVAFAQRGLAVPEDHREGLVLHFPAGARTPERYPVGLDAARSVGAIVRRKLADADWGATENAEVPGTSA